MKYQLGELKKIKEIKKILRKKILSLGRQGLTQIVNDSASNTCSSARQTVQAVKLIEGRGTRY